MFKGLKRVLVLLTLAVLAGVLFFGCSSDEEGLIDYEKMDKYIKNGGYSFMYVLTEKDFESLKKELEAGKDVKKCIENGVLCLTAKDKVRLLPALNIPKDVLKKAISIIKAACEED